MKTSSSLQDENQSEIITYCSNWSKIVQEDSVSKRELVQGTISKVISKREPIDTLQSIVEGVDVGYMAGQKQQRIKETIALS